MPNAQAHTHERVLSLHPFVQLSSVYEGTGLSSVSGISTLSRFAVLTRHCFSPFILSPIPSSLTVLFC